MARFTTDDALYRVSGVWVDVGGKRMPIVARYVTWGLFVSYLVLTGIPLVLLAGWVGLLYAVVIAAGGAAFTTDAITGERTFGAWLSILGGEARAQTRARARARARRVEATTAHRIRHH